MRRKRKGLFPLAPLSRFGVDWFNADDRAAELNLGSFHKIPAEIRSQVNVGFSNGFSSTSERAKALQLKPLCGARSLSSKPAWHTATAFGQR